jgi:hypothetical protein
MGGSIWRRLRCSMDGGHRWRCTGHLEDLQGVASLYGCRRCPAVRARTGRKLVAALYSSRESTGRIEPRRRRKLAVIGVTTALLFIGYAWSMHVMAASARQPSDSSGNRYYVGQFVR